MKSTIQLLVFCKIFISFSTRHANAAEKDYIYLELSPLVRILHDNTTWRWNGTIEKFEDYTKEDMNSAKTKGININELNSFTKNKSILTSPYIKPPNGSTWFYLFSTITNKGFWLKIKDADK